MTAPPSALEALRARRKQLAEATTRTFPIPGYGGVLQTRYRLLGLEAIAGLPSMQDQSDGGLVARHLLDAACDFLVAACDEVLLYRDGKHERLLDAEAPIRYDETLAEVLEVTADSAREVVLGVFAGNEPAVIEHLGRVTRWMQRADEDVDEAFLGESQGAATSEPQPSSGSQD
jgi:hypothetical protein